MANEISVTLGVQVKNGHHVDKFEPGTVQITQSSAGRGGHVQNIGTSEEVVDFGDISTNGVLALRNLSTTDYIVYGPEDTNAMVIFGKLKPGEIAFLRVAPTVVMRAQADTNAALMDVRLYED